jgi:hypothetical protein
VAIQSWEVDVFVEEDDERRVSTITIEASDADEAVLRAVAEISRALTFLSPFAKVLGARARRRQ